MKALSEKLRTYAQNNEVGRTTQEMQSDEQENSAGTRSDAGTSAPRSRANAYENPFSSHLFLPLPRPLCADDFLSLSRRCMSFSTRKNRSSCPGVSTVAKRSL